MKKKLGVDLDHTVVFSDILEHSGYDFTHEFENENKRYFYKRKHSQDFFNWAVEHFDVYIITAASRDYAEVVINNFKIKDKIKGLISRSDLGSLETVKDDLGYSSEEYLKKIDDFIMVDDKPHVVKGNNNIVIKVQPSWTNPDDDLLDVIKQLEQLLFEKTILKVRETFNSVYFFGDIFSNFYNCNFEIAGRKYVSVEQYYMSKKAEFFNCLYIANQIMSETNSLKIKKLGKNSNIEGFDQDQWQLFKNDFMFQACFAKFSQNKDLTKKLLDTKDKLLVEASPYDLYWGAGLSLNDPSILENNFPGKNQLGIILMEVRKKLANSI